MPGYLLSVEAHTETTAAWLRQRWCAPKPEVLTFSFTKAAKQSLLPTVLYYLKWSCLLTDYSPAPHRIQLTEAEALYVFVPPLQSRKTSGFSKYLAN